LPFGELILPIFLGNVVGSWQLLVILVGVRQKAEGRREERRKIPEILMGQEFQNFCLLPSASCLLP